MTNQRIPINIVLTYPVHWSRYQVLRDFVQNFYDSVGMKEFNNRFHVGFESDTIAMWAEQISFSYEWLLHIGASTKGKATDQAGYFGEGFKIASLCAFRDYQWDIIMQSADWSLHVVSEGRIIDSQEIQMLAYDLSGIECSGNSQLIIRNVSKSDFDLLQDVIKSFYYPENPLFGELLWSGRDGAVYTRSTEPIPDTLPTCYEFGRKGAVYCAYQMLGTNPFDLVVCFHPYQRNDRERKTLYRFHVIDIFGKVAARMDAAGAAKMLIRMRRYWNSQKKKRIDIDSWCCVIDTLIYKISLSKEETEKFRNQFPSMLYTVKIQSIIQRNRRVQAKAWLSGQKNKYLLVRNSFSILGYPSLEDVCEKNGGFVADSSLREKKHIEAFHILQDFIAEVFSGFLMFPNGFPESRIILNENASFHGMADCHKLDIPLPTTYASLKIKSRISAIYLKKSVFDPCRFNDALATYIHESCHMFGGDRSQSFSLALTIAMEILLENQNQVAHAEARWKNLFSCQ